MPWLPFICRFSPVLCRLGLALAPELPDQLSVLRNSLVESDDQQLRTTALQEECIMYVQTGKTFIATVIAVVLALGGLAVLSSDAHRDAPSAFARTQQNA